ncbi:MULTISPECIES: STAS domain-containing protein [Thioclava]|uniref:Anti-sigma factor antagonist n=1 Tax=Thioclava nitratireducens TaxID=1915078 RepID=A0ABM6ILL7_9RHOB|nr:MULTISPECIES: STAS domain-containing protein [Thioclava]AQS49565.1 anti-anti-sigma factor [Thioclava nitratireducens]OWY00097.1 anti-anti-sigma factor [Thioclava sp. IC9]OWY00705.1 anti-anti-sigma factor [Thioclava sp. F1Mire-8]WGT48753.1 STAS domain-containing protein [Thioclava nitratireducens]
MNLTAEALKGALVVHLAEARLDAAIALRFKERMRDVTMQPAPRVLLDLSKVEFLDSSGLGAVVAVMKSLAPDRQLELCGLTPNVVKVFRLTRMNSVLPIHADLATALGKDRRYA